MSIGRAQGSRLQRVDSHDSLNAHPLISSNRPSSPSPDHAVDGHSVPRYVPYTPRQRVAPMGGNVGPIVHPPSPQQSQGDAATRLQMMNLRAAVQSVGLDTGTIGWGILEKLALEGEAAEWAELWAAVTSGKVSVQLN